MPTAGSIVPKRMLNPCAKKIASAFFEVRSDLFCVDRCLFGVGKEDDDEIGLADGGRNVSDSQARRFGLRSRRGALAEADSNVDPRIAKVERVRVAL